MIISVDIGMCMVAMLGIIFSVQMVAGQGDDTERLMVFEEVKKILKVNDTYKAIEYINSQGEPQVVAKRYLELAMDFYWKEKALSEVINFAEAGIHYCLLKAQEYSKDEAETAVKLKGTAMALSYNLASFTWPGWNEKGIVISESDLIVGLDAARLNLRLATELKKGPTAISVSHWAIGAQYMALGKYDEAITAFTAAKEKAGEAKDNLSELMNLGYIGMAKILEGSEKDEGQKQFDEAIKGLKKQNTEDANFYIEQLKVALEVFSK